MNLLGDAPWWGQVALVLLLLAAAAQDVAKRRISNWWCLAVIVTAVTVAIAMGPSFALWQNALLFVIVIVGSLPLFAAGWLGGGDVKLLAAVALWADFGAILPLVALVLLAGGAIAMVGLAIAPKPLRKSSRGVPYAVAIAAGTIGVMAHLTLFELDHSRASTLRPERKVSSRLGRVF